MRQEQKILLIINPAAGRTAAHKALFDAVETLCAQQTDIVCQPTSYPGEARELAAQAAGYERIICCGGDGTLNEVLSGLTEAGLSIPVGYVPAGTTNDLARTLGLSSQPEESIPDALEGLSHPYDLGRFNGSRYFDYVASFGAFTDAAYATPQLMKNLLGRTAYILWGAGHLLGLHPIRLTAHSHEWSAEGEFLFGSVSNSTEIGGMIHLPKEQVQLDDGKFEVLLVRRCRGLDCIAMLLGLLRGDYSNPKYFHHLKTDHITFSFEEEVMWTLDGESSAPCKTAEITVLPRAVQLVWGRK